MRKQFESMLTIIVCLILIAGLLFVQEPSQQSLFLVACLIAIIFIEIVKIIGRKVFNIQSFSDIFSLKTRKRKNKS